MIVNSVLMLKQINSYLTHWIFTDRYIYKDNKWICIRNEYKNICPSINDYIIKNHIVLYFIHLQEFNELIKPDESIRQLFILCHYGYGDKQMRIELFDQYLYFIREGDSWVLKRRKPEDFISKRVNQFIYNNQIREFKISMTESFILSPDGQELILHLILCLIYRKD